MQDALATAYEHPWHKLKDSVYLYTERELWKHEIKKPKRKMSNANEQKDYEHASQDDIGSVRGSEQQDHSNIDRLLKERKSMK